MRAAKTLPEPRFDEVIWLDSTPIARIIGTWSTVDAVHFIHTDHLNSPRALSNARIQGSQPSGTVVWRWPLVTDPSLGSNAFGNQAAIVDPDANSVVTFFSLRFPGQQYEANSGLHYNYFRDYEPSTGRYVESDPIGLRGGISTYGYVGGSPIAQIDPKGLTAWRCRRPLCPEGTINCTSGERGPPVANHSYLCVTRLDGSIECGGQSTDDWGVHPTPGRPTRPNEDSYNERSCDVVDDDSNRCVEACLLTNFPKPRPTYAYNPAGADCHEWMDDLLWGCRAHCRRPNNINRFQDR